MTPEQKNQNAIRRCMVELRAEIERLWKRGNRESAKLVQSGLHEEEQRLWRLLWRRTEALQDEIAQYRRRLPPFVVYRHGYYEKVPVTPELVAQAERMDQEARR